MLYQDVMLYQVKSGLSGYKMLGEVNSGYVKLGQVKSLCVTLGQVMLG
jgi:hypothetical protein